jgi:hypothetical protein
MSCPEAGHPPTRVVAVENTYTADDWRIRLCG